MMNMKRLILLIVHIVLIFYLYTLTAQENWLPVFVTDSLENYITRGMIKWKIPGLSNAIIKDGEVKFIKGFGVTRAVTIVPSKWSIYSGQRWCWLLAFPLKRLNVVNATDFSNLQTR
jgi:hypothetical protein